MDSEGDSPTRQEVIRGRIDTYFDLFSRTLELSEQLIPARSHGHEVLILLCSRLDALASSAFREGYPNRKAFVDFVTGYGRRRNLLQSISVGDLYHELAYHRWFLPTTIPKPGRLNRFSRVDDPILTLLVQSDIPLTERDADRLLGGIMRALRETFRVMPGQPLSKRHLATRNDVVNEITKAFDSPRKRNIAEALPQALGHLLDAKKMATILYEKFRSEAIHGARVQLDNRRFFRDSDPYWVPRYSESVASYLLAEFPARFLVNLLSDCIKTYRRHLISKGVLPADIIYAIFEDDFLAFIDLLDEEMLPEYGAVQFRLEKR
ncbi:MAG: hypothetical protein ACE5JI_20280 [Acidobacteriota bacterium]